MSPTVMVCDDLLHASTQPGSCPRPMLLRSRWVSLDGPAGFAVDDRDLGQTEQWWADPAHFDRTIVLPHPPESEASGIGDTQMHPVVWYRIAVGSRTLQEAGHGPGRRLLLHFGAVDHDATIWVDGTEAGHHEGGQTAFGLDITEALVPGAPEHVIVVRAFDDPHDNSQPRGKQTGDSEPGFIWYERCTGIWRPVWLESVPAPHVTRLSWVTLPGQDRVELTIDLSDRPQRPLPLRVRLSHRDRQLAERQTALRALSTVVDIPLPGSRALAWSPEHPRLLDASLTVGEDEIGSYLGVREVGVGPRGLLLDGQPVFLRQVLEQCYWPGSLYSAPDADALREEAELVARLGFNGMRIHQLTPDPRLLLWADRLGLLVFAEIGTTHEFTAHGCARLQREWAESVRANRSHPSIICWVPVNESWGVLGLAHEPEQARFAAGLAQLTRNLDPTRPALSNDGWEHTDSDLLTIHAYSGSPGLLRRQISAGQVHRMLSGEEPGPAGRALVVGTQQRTDAPVLLDEFGGIRFGRHGSASRGWGYSTARSRRGFLHRVRGLVGAALSSGTLAGYCWTQLTDVRQELNGLCDEQRRPKLPAAALRQVFGPR